MRVVHFLFGMLWVSACDPVVQTLHRDNCLVCHVPLEPPVREGQASTAGIEDAHPAHALSCTDCHGGDARVCDGLEAGTPEDPRCDGEWRYDERLAHVDPGTSPTALDALSAADLDAVDRAYLRFRNPADLRVVSETCGRCHVDEVAAVRRSGHALQTGDLAIGRFRAGLQPDVVPRFGAAPETDPRPRPDPCTAAAVTRFSPLPIEVASSAPRTRPSPENVLDQLLVQQCLGCHLHDTGPAEARTDGTHRGGGCAACHVAYAADGLSRSGDPWVPEDEPGHPVSHGLVARPPTETCVACHRDGARIGLSFQGLREVTPGTAPPHAVGFERTLYGLPPGALLRDEDGRNGFDETPPDLHFEAGMDCIDCHGAWEVHGDGHLGADRTCVEGATRCEDCHGDREREADLRLARHALSRGPGGEVRLTLRRTGRVLVVPQVAQVAGNDAAARAHTEGHMGSLDCATCHAGWVPSCYGCHVDHDLRESGRYLTNASLVPGRATTRILASRTDDLVLMWNRRGKLQPSMPAERLFLTLRGGDPAGSLLFEDAPRSLPGESPSGRVPSFGQRTVDPHTTRRTSPFSRCERCHTKGDGTNAALLDVTHGFGSEGVRVEACDVARDAACGPGGPRTTHALDATIGADGVPLVVPGHGASRPLSLEEIDRMRAVIVD